MVVTDGSPNDLREVLEQGSITLLRPGCAPSDLYTLSRSRVLIGSGGSSFSAWASFFAQCPTVTIPGHSLAWFKLDHGASIYVGDFDPRSPPELFCKNLLALRRDLTGVAIH